MKLDDPMIIYSLTAMLNNLINEGYNPDVRELKLKEFELNGSSQFAYSSGTQFSRRKDLFLCP